jgi:hypothetical protein
MVVVRFDFHLFSPFFIFYLYSDNWKFKLCCFREYEILARVPIILNK